jgi:2-succinyl-6-hydroxy-2,4-cyclohexadiene-1-carboxylate synthase
MSDIAASTIGWHVEWHGAHGRPVLCLVHGFAGSLRTWDVIIPALAEHFHLLLVDLPGHGRTPLPDEREMNLERLGIALGQLIRNAVEGPAMLCGYSMGGRVALHTALFAPEFVTALGLIGTSLGIEEDDERAIRREADSELAALIRGKRMAWFAEYWTNLPLFQSQRRLSEEVQKRLYQARLDNDPEALAWCLDHYGTGTQDFLGPRLSHLKIPLLLLAGALDTKFCAIHRRMEKLTTAAPVHRVEIADAGHAAHIEAPSAVAREMIEFFETASNPA